MKITIDLNDPEIQAQINAQVDARLNMIAAERIQAVVDSILSAKMERLTDAKIDQLANRIIEQKINSAFIKPNWSAPSEFSKVLAEETSKIIKANLAAGGQMSAEGERTFNE